MNNNKYSDLATARQHRWGFYATNSPNRNGNLFTIHDFSDERRTLHDVIGECKRDIAFNRKLGCSSARAIYLDGKRLDRGGDDIWAVRDILEAFDDGEREFSVSAWTKS